MSITAKTCSVLYCGNPVLARSFCQTHYARFRRHGDPLAHIPIAEPQWRHLTIEENFWRQVNKNGPVPSHIPNLGQCWVWTGGTLRHGYGSFHINCGPDGLPHSASHRYSYVLAFGPIPEGLHVLHKCDNPPCVNPFHLFIGTQADNMRDMVAKQRAYVQRHKFYGAENGMVRHPESVLRGERNPHAKLTDELVTAMRKRAKSGESIRWLAAEHGLSISTARHAICASTWAHVQEPPFEVKR